MTKYPLRSYGYALNLGVRANVCPHVPGAREMSETIKFDVIDERGPQTYSGTYAFTPAEVDRDEVLAIGPTEIEVHAEKGDLPAEYIVEGRLDFTAEFNCSRCLEPYPIANSSEFHIRFRPRPEGSEENEEIEIAATDELDVEFYGQREIPLRNLALEQVELSVPMKTLCDEKCLGLCTHCGANRNREQCSCEASVVDERWGALQELRNQLPKKRDG